MNSKVEELIKKGYNKRTAYRLVKKEFLDVKSLPVKEDDYAYKFSKGEFV